MILYFDVYIIDEPLMSHSIKSIKKIRNSNTIYRMPRKLDITKYSLASYKIFPWSKVIIKFDVAKEEDKEPFIKYAREIFPDAEIITHRSDNQKEYCKTINEICKLDDEWIFFSPNNDHPMVTSDINYIYKIIEKANEYKYKYKFVSIIFTMVSACCNIKISEYLKDAKIIENTNESLVVVKPNGYFMSGLILHKDLLKYLFCSHNLGDLRITRLENIQNLIEIHNQIVISPKKEICAHFDGYSNTYGTDNQITEDQVPPLFIPPGFFENDIKIAYGYDEYRDGWVNINPSKKYFSFRNKKDITDLKIGVEDIPLFWRNRISELDVNVRSDINELKHKRDEYYEVFYNPWKDLTYRIHINIKSFLYHSIYVSSVVFIRNVWRKLWT